MKAKKLVSFNINGIRAGFRKGLREWILDYQPDFLGLQETKAWREQLKPSEFEIPGYHFLISQPSRKGYSGVGVYCKEIPQEVIFEWMQEEAFDTEGRVVFVRFSQYVVLNVYFPNGVSNSTRLAYKMAFYEKFLQKVQALLDAGEKVLVMGDVNTAHKPIDLSRPKENVRNSGFLPQERDWIDRFLQIGMIDTFRHFYPDKEEAYSWWDMKTAARERNVGWRIDYVFASKNLKDALVSAQILAHVPGSDHCPVVLELQ
ncbi:MAG: exodeoxyribonuclease III [Spirochaetia bacterium]